jgi:hypothetical protein
MLSCARLAVQRHSSASLSNEKRLPEMAAFSFLFTFYIQNIKPGS